MKNEHLINLELSSKNNSAVNHRRVKAQGIEPYEHYNIKGSLHIAFYPSKHTVGKRYYKGNREIKKDTFLNNLERTK